VNQNSSGLYGKTAAYYADSNSKEDWLCSAHASLCSELIISQEIRESNYGPNSDFQKRIVEYLGSVHVGEFMTGTMEKSETSWENMKPTNIKDPTQTLPDAPPDHRLWCNNVNLVKITASWWEISKYCGWFNPEIKCSKMSQLQFHWWKKQKKERRGCINKHEICKARFPWQTFEKTEVDLKPEYQLKGWKMDKHSDPIVTFCWD